jgi:hypothetical protein
MFVVMYELSVPKLDAKYVTDVVWKKKQQYFETVVRAMEFGEAIELDKRTLKNIAIYEQVNWKPSGTLNAQA